MSLERRNIDFAFPTFAPGLPSVYERAGFDVRVPSPSIRSAKSKASSRNYRPPTSSPQVPQAPVVPPLPVQKPAFPVSEPAPAPVVPAVDDAPPVAPPRAASRATRPLHIAANSIASLSSVPSSYHTVYSRGSQSSSGTQSSSGSQETQNTSQGEPFDTYNFQNSTSQFDFTLPPKPGHLSCSSSVYSEDSPRLSQRASAFAPQVLADKPQNVAPLTASAPFVQAPAQALVQAPVQAHVQAPERAAPAQEMECPYPFTPDAEAFGFEQTRPGLPLQAPEHARRASEYAAELNPPKPQEPLDLHTQHTHSSSSSESNNTQACRGCFQVITGRSVYSKDGNMSGRWHKQCFKCSGCEIKLRGEVYVLSDSPFCQECYHFSNKTLCTACDQGIEGPCLENESARFHPDCLKCNICQVHLQDYYEANGRTYCEAHGAHADQARKRTTRFVGDFL